jgi:hypothetical protein
MSREPNRVRRLIETAAKARALADRCDRVLRAKYGFSQVQLRGLEIAARAKGTSLNSVENLAAVFGAKAQQLSSLPRGILGRPPQSVLGLRRRGSVF